MVTRPAQIEPIISRLGINFSFSSGFLGSTATACWSSAVESILFAWMTQDKTFFANSRKPPPWLSILIIACLYVSSNPLGKFRNASSICPTVGSRARESICSGARRNLRLKLESIPSNNCRVRHTFHQRPWIL